MITVTRKASTTLGSAFAAFGGALAKGEDGFKAFANSLLSTFGSMAIELGTLLIAKGFAIDQLKASLLSFSGGPAIAAGAALVAIGGALQALASGPVGGGSTATPGGEPVTTAGEETITDNNLVEGIEKQAAVTVNVDGTVLDPLSVGEQIASVLTEAGFSNGAVTA